MKVRFMTGIVKTKACFFCKLITSNPENVLLRSSFAPQHAFIPNYCPKCGKKLKKRK